LAISFAIGKKKREREKERKKRKNVGRQAGKQEDNDEYLEYVSNHRHCFVIRVYSK
jgi:hypothetical protein